MKALPAFNQYGFLPEGIHPTTLGQVEPILKTNPRREKLWNNLTKFLVFVEDMGTFSHVYMGGGFVSVKESPRDIDLILETTVDYGPRSLQAMLPFFDLGLTQIYKTYTVHLHFWARGFPGQMKDFRHFFQYTHPKEQKRVPLEVKKGIIRVKLQSKPALKVRKIALHCPVNLTR